MICHELSLQKSAFRIEIYSGTLQCKIHTFVFHKHVNDRLCVGNAYRRVTANTRVDTRILQEAPHNITTPATHRNEEGCWTPIDRVWVVRGTHTYVGQEKINETHMPTKARLL